MAGRRARNPRGPRARRALRIRGQPRGEGGAVHVSGGEATCESASWIATKPRAAAARSSAGGTVTLTKGTLLIANMPQSIVSRVDGALTYRLPSPSAATSSPGSDHEVLDEGSYPDYPYPCAPGLGRDQRDERAVQPGLRRCYLGCVHGGHRRSGRVHQGRPLSRGLGRRHAVPRGLLGQCHWARERARPLRARRRFRLCGRLLAHAVQRGDDCRKRKQRALLGVRNGQVPGR